MNTNRQQVWVVISDKGFILGVYATSESAQIVIRNNPQHTGCRISHEFILP